MAEDKFDSLYARAIVSPPDEHLGMETEEEVFNDRDQNIIHHTAYLQELVAYLSQVEDGLLDPEYGGKFSPEARIAKVEVVRNLKNKIEDDLHDSRRKGSA